MKRVKLTQVLLTIPVLATEDDYDLEVDDEVLGIVELSQQCLAKVSDELAEHAQDAKFAEQRYESMTLEEFRAPPVRTRPRGRVQ